MAVNPSRGEWKIRANVFDPFTERTLFQLAGKGFFGDLESPVALGKEANVFSASAGRESEGKEKIIVKIYRLENSNFKKMYEYLQQDPRYMHAKPAKRDVILSWCQREYRNLMLARESINVPTPIGYKNNVLVLSFIGDAINAIPAPQLKDSAPTNPETFCKAVLERIAILWKHGLVHGDLSAFNILNDGDQPVFIDFSQSSPTSAPNAKELLRRDLTNLAAYFKKHGVKLDVEKEMEKVVKGVKLSRR